MSISENLGLRAMIDRLEAMGEKRFHRMHENGVDNVLIILVNAAVKRESFIEQHPRKPKAATTMGVFIDSQMKRYDQESIERARKNIDRFQALAKGKGMSINMYFAEVSFDDVQLDGVSSLLNNMPTSLELDSNAVDKLIASGRLLLRHEPEFKRYKTDNGGSLSGNAISDRDICKYFAHPNCANL